MQIAATTPPSRKPRLRFTVISSPHNDYTANRFLMRRSLFQKSSFPGEVKCCEALIPNNGTGSTPMFMAIPARGPWTASTFFDAHRDHEPVTARKAPLSFGRGVGVRGIYPGLTRKHGSFGSNRALVNRWQSYPHAPSPTHSNELVSDAIIRIIFAARL